MQVNRKGMREAFKLYEVNHIPTAVDVCYYFSYLTNWMYVNFYYVDYILFCKQVVLRVEEHLLNHLS